MAQPTPQPRPHPSDRSQRSYLGAALRAPENRIAAVITAVIAIVVVMTAAGAPLTHTLRVDLTTLGSFRTTAHASPVGFVWPRADGATTTGDTARIVFNRPLPERFTLAIDGACTAGCDDGAFEIVAGDSRVQADLAQSDGRVSVDVANPDGARTLGLTLQSGTRLRIRELVVTPEEVGS